MNQKVRYQIRIARQARASRSDKSKLTLFLRVFPLWGNEPDFILSSKLTVEVNKWGQEKKQAKGTSLESIKINKFLNDLEVDIHEHFDAYVKSSQDVSMKGFKNHLNRYMYGKGDEEEMGMKVSGIFDHYLVLNATNLGDKRKSRYTRVKQMVNEFNQHKFGNIEVGLEVLNVEWWKAFSEFVETKYKIQKSTRKGYLKVLKAAVNNAVSTGHLSSNPFATCRLEKIEETIRYLSSEELVKLEQFKAPNAVLQRAVDLFLFASYTGLAYSDLRALSLNDLQTGEDGSVVAMKARSKTSVMSKIPLSPEALGIIERFKNYPSLSGTNLLLPVPNLSDYNKTLKHAAALCQINKPISSHVARHTFATSVWLESSGSIETLQKILGHKKIQTTARYGTVTNVRISNEARRVFAQRRGELK